MKSSEDIKKGLDCCADGNVVCAGNCVFDDDVKLGFPDCVKLLMTNALALIQQKEKENAEQAEKIRQLEAQNAELLKKVEQLQAERDAAVNDLGNVCKMMSICNACKDRFEGGERCRGCFCSSHWEWRGVQKEG